MSQDIVTLQQETQVYLLLLPCIRCILLVEIKDLRINKTKSLKNCKVELKIDKVD